MGIEFLDRLDMTFEILGLIYSSRHMEDYFEKEEFLDIINQYGINGEELYKKVMLVVRRYVRTFHKECIFCDEAEFFFEDMNDDFVLLLQNLYIYNPHWFNGFSGMNDDELMIDIVNGIIEKPVRKKKLNMKEVIGILQNVGLDSNICWKLMVLLQSPKEKLTVLTDLIKSNEYAFKQALEAVENQLKQLLESFPSGQYKLSSPEKDIEIRPVLIYPLVEVEVKEGKGYAGLFLHEFYNMLDKKREDRDKVLPILKALSDASKYDILMSVKNTPKYNMELAEELNLTAATTSHHMSVLLVQGLVTVEKKDGKTYYSLVKEAMENLIHELEGAFL